MGPGHRVKADRKGNPQANPLRADAPLLEQALAKVVLAPPTVSACQHP